MKIWRLIISIVLLLTSLAMVQAGSDSPLVFGVRWSPDGRWIAANTNQGLWLFDAENPETEATIYFEGQRIGAVEFDQTGTYVAVGNSTNRDDEVVSILELETGTVLQELQPEKTVEDFFPVIYDLLYSHDGQYLLAANNGVLTIYDTESWEIVNVINLSFEGDYGSSHWITSMTQIGETGSSYIVSNWNQDLYLINAVAGVRESYHLPNMESTLLYAAEFLDTNRLLLHTGEGIYIYTMERDLLEPLLQPIDDDFVAGYAYSSQNEMLIVGGLGIWQAFNVADKEAMLDVRLANEEARVFAFDFNPDGSQFVSLQTDGVITIWDLETGEELGVLGEFESAFDQKWG